MTTEMLERSLGIYNFVWWFMACAALWLLFRVYQLLKAIHFMNRERFKREFREAFRDE